MNTKLTFVLSAVSSMASAMLLNEFPFLMAHDGNIFYVLCFIYWGLMEQYLICCLCL